MKEELSQYLLYGLLGGAVVFAAAAIFRFIEPEGSNLVQVSLVIGVLLGIVLGVIFDRIWKKR